MSKLSKETNRRIINIIIENLEKMTFMEVEEVTDHIDEKPLTRPFIASISVRSPFLDKFELIMPRTLIVDIAQELFSPENIEISDRLVKDVIAELVNTLAGCVMAELVGDSNTFRLGIPDVREEPITKEVTTFYGYKFTMGEENFLLNTPDEKIMGDFFKYQETSADVKVPELCGEVE